MRYFINVLLIERYLGISTAVLGMSSILCFVRLTH